MIDLVDRNEKMGRLGQPRRDWRQALVSLGLLAATAAVWYGIAVCLLAL